RRHLPLLEIDSGDGGAMKGPAWMSAEQIAQGKADLVDGQLVRGHLVEERLEGLVAVLIDERDADRSLLERLERGHSAEAPPEDEHVRLGDRALGIHARSPFVTASSQQQASIVRQVVTDPGARRALR